MDKHLKADCAYAVVKCDFAYAGCAEEFKRKEKQNHEKHSCEKHLALISVKFVELKENFDLLLKHQEMMRSSSSATNKKTEIEQKAVVDNNDKTNIFNMKDIFPENSKQQNENITNYFKTNLSNTKSVAAVANNKNPTKNFSSNEKTETKYSNEKSETKYALREIRESHEKKGKVNIPTFELESSDDEKCSDEKPRAAKNNNNSKVEFDFISKGKSVKNDFRKNLNTKSQKKANNCDDEDADFAIGSAEEIAFEDNVNHRDDNPRLRKEFNMTAKRTRGKFNCFSYLGFFIFALSFKY